ncbi:MAG: guanylate kinase [Firmicutes bacterium]|nr:guanylate kinase [Bacillota bacterium]
MKNNKGNILILSGCAGSGKGTILKRVFELSDRFRYSVSLTTRSPRPGEVEGVSYYFVTKEQFFDYAKNGKLVEYTEYCDNFYGTPYDRVVKMRDEGYIVVLEIETDGARQVMDKFDDYISVFITPPSYSVLEHRLRNRGTETEDSIVKRLKRSKTELVHSKVYDHILINYDNRVDDVARAIIGICSGEDPQSFPVRINDIDDFILKYSMNDFGGAEK